MRLQLLKLKWLIKKSNARFKQKWRSAFDIFYAQVKGNSLFFLPDIRQPDFYKELRRAEIGYNFKWIDQSDFRVFGDVFDINKVRITIFIEQ